MWHLFSASPAEPNFAEIAAQFQGASPEIGAWARGREGRQHTSGYPVSEKKRVSKRPPSARAFATILGNESRMGGTATMAYPHRRRRRPIDHGLSMCTTTSTYSSGKIRVLHADDADGGWCGFTGAGNTSSVLNLEVEKVGVADSLTRAVITMVIIVGEQIKCSSARKQMRGTEKSKKVAGARRAPTVTYATSSWTPL